MKYNDNGEYKDIYIKSFDTLPVGTEVDYDGSVVPDGWSEVSAVETIYDQDNLVIKKYGNAINIYSKGFINQGILENYELPEAIRPSTTILLSGIAVISGSLVARAVSYGTSSHKFAVRDTGGASTTSYTSITFSVTYFVE